MAGTSYSDYNRSLDLDTGIHTSTSLISGDNSSKLLTTSLFCSYPAQSCVYAISSDTRPLPGPVTVSLGNQLMNSSLVNVTCGDGLARLSGITQADIGMKFDAVARVLQSAGNSSNVNITTSCSPDQPGLLVIQPSPEQTSLAIIFSAESNYDETKGTAQDNYSFRADQDPGDVVEQRTAELVASQTYQDLLEDHTKDFSDLMGLFSLNIPDTANSSGLETSELVARYTNQSSDPYLESLLFDYSRYLLISSVREGSLPPNLQGLWTESLVPAWDGSYVTDINLQMAYWGAEQTGLGGLAQPLFDFMTNTWAPRGTETAQLLYNGSGWVAHAEMNTFGYTGMEEVAMWTNCESVSSFATLTFPYALTKLSITPDPASVAWLMQHVFDHYDYSRNVTWLAESGYPLLKSIASFWVSQLQEDLFFNDGTLVVNPCNSPEHGPTTFGCTHYGQVIHQVFEAVLSTASLVSDADTAFLDQVGSALARLDTGIHIDNENSTDTIPGVLREWKVPDSYLYNVYPVHRHISHLVGWFPGYSISSFAGGYTNATLQKAVRASLIARGDGTDLDGDGGNYGWPKVWRGACWARLNDSAKAYEELQLSISNNLAPNLLSMYGYKSPPFQIDMNYGWAGNVLSMLVVDLPLASAVTENISTRTVVLGPAIPAAWGGGSIKGLRIRGGMVVDIEWDDQGVVTQKQVVSGATTGVRFVNVDGQEL